MDLTFMESVWSVFKQLFDKGQVYRSYQVMPYSTGLCTPLSQFEAQQNRKMTQDPAIVVSFKLLHHEDESTYLLIWTTTPWTLPSNIAIAVHPNYEYVKIFDQGVNRNYILLESCMSTLYKNPKQAKYKILSRIRGEQMVGWKYQPVFDFFLEQFHVCFRVIPSAHVMSDEGTGLVHMAPAFGADDYTAALDSGLIKADRLPPNPVDEKGCFTAEVVDYAGQYVKAAEKAIVKQLRATNHLVVEGQISHDIAYCWRSETPLIQKAVAAWFIKVVDDIPQIIRGIEESNWVPSFVKERRFANWIKNAKDWNVSRNRYWGTPIPIWASADYEEIVCVGSIAELKELSGSQEEIQDLHRDIVDQITIPSKTGKGILKRVEEVFDCW